MYGVKIYDLYRKRRELIHNTDEWDEIILLFFFQTNQVNSTKNTMHHGLIDDILKQLK